MNIESVLVYTFRLIYQFISPLEKQSWSSSQERAMIQNIKTRILFVLKTLQYVNKNRTVNYIIVF